MIKIALAEDIPSLAEAMRKKLGMQTDFELKHVASNGKELIDLLEKDHNIDLILMDIKMPEMNGIEATKQVNSRWPQIKVIMCTVFDDDENIFNAIQAGADGYLLKDTEPKELYNAILQTREGGAVMTPSIALKTLNLLRSPLETKTDEEDETIKLTNREIEVLEQLATGLPYTAIAENLIVAPSTIRRHIENIYHKLQVHSKTEAIAFARRKRLI